jgi:hypothetical protein
VLTAATAEVDEDADAVAADPDPDKPGFVGYQPLLLVWSTSLFPFPIKLSPKTCTFPQSP